MTTENFLNQAPPEIRELYIIGLANLRERKKTLAGLITANRANIFNKDELMTMDLRTLSGMVRMMGGAVFSVNINDFIAPEMPKTFELTSI